MSDFACQKCGVAQVDSDVGYVAGCQHYPPEHSRMVRMHFGGGITNVGFYDGAFYITKKAQRDGRAVHPIEWKNIEGTNQ